MRTSIRRRRLIRVCAALCVVACISPNAVTPETPSVAPNARPTASQRRFCTLALSCALPGAATACREVGAERQLDEHRCSLARDLMARGLSPDAPLGFRVYQFLGSRYQVEYSVSGELPLSKERLSFLIDDLPLAARLLSRFQKTRYQAEYVEGNTRRFRAAKGDKVKGEAEWISGSATEGALYCFGRGESRLAWWKLRGLGLVRAEFLPAPEAHGVRYRIRVVASPANAAVDIVMRLGLFRSAVEGEVRDLLRDVGEASRKLEAAGPELTPLTADWSADDRAKLIAFLKLP